MLTVDVSHSQPKELQVIFREKEAGAPQELKEKKLIKLEKKYRGERMRILSQRAAVNCEKKYVARQIYLKKKDFEDFGWTRGCARCFRIRMCGKATRESRPHSQQCRDRITNELAKAAAGQLRIANSQARKLDENMGEKRCNFINK